MMADIALIVIRNVIIWDSAKNLMKIKSANILLKIFKSPLNRTGRVGHVACVLAAES